MTEAHAGDVCARSLELPPLEVNDARGAGGGARELSALPQALTGGAGSRPAGLPALERASGGAAAVAAERIRAVPAATARAARSDHPALPAMGDAVARGTRARAAQPGALAPDEPGR